ncbi:MAG: tetratricopeptide repeat protein [Bacteroidales bacterium]|nr:tetratricopeptide repeat protein [Bacteroidales bacterium]
MRYYLVIMLLAIAMLVHGAESRDSLYLSASSAYSDGNYELALEKYEQIADQGYAAPDLYYNMGNAAFRSNRLGYAVLYYNKALKLDPSHEEAEKNLAYVSRYKEDQLEQVPELFIRTWVRSLVGLFSVQTWAYVAIFMFGILLVALLFYIFASRLAVKKAGFFTGLVTLLLFLISFTAALERNNEIVAPDQAVIVSPSVVVKSSPSLSGTDLFVLHEGTEITLTDQVGEWTEVRISDGRIGWVPSGTFEVI